MGMSLRKDGKRSLRLPPFTPEDQPGERSLIAEAKSCVWTQSAELKSLL